MPCMQVFILGRMGNAREALQLIIDQLGDVPQVRLPCPLQAGLPSAVSPSLPQRSTHALCSLTDGSSKRQPAVSSLFQAIAGSHWCVYLTAAFCTMPSRKSGACHLQAIEFVQMQGDDELWELLITLALGSAEFTGMHPHPSALNFITIITRLGIAMRQWTEAAGLLRYLHDCVVSASTAKRH